VALYLKNSHSLKSYRYPSFPSIFDIFPVNLLLVRSHQTEIIVVKRLIQEHNNATKVGVELTLRDRDHSQQSP